ncbi:MAG: phage/plasmid primase, P4 family [Planctomycetota bacterium]
MQSEREHEAHESTDAVRFLTAIFVPGDTVLIRPVETWTEANKQQSRADYDGIVYHTVGLGLPGGRRAAYPKSTKHAMDRITERAAVERTNVFFGTCPRFAPANERAATSYDLAWQIRTIRCLWADIDGLADGREGIDQALTRCSDANLPIPSIVVASGHGIHAYWLLDYPVILDDYPDSVPLAVHTEFTDRGDGGKKRRRQYIYSGNLNERLYLDLPHHRPPLSPKAQAIQDTLAGIAQAIGGDHTTDLSRILRVPGTLNRKNERNGTPPVPCTLITCDPNRRYPISAFAKFEASSPQKIDRERIVKMPLPKQKKLGTRGQTRLDALVADCVAADSGTRSETDYALCCWAVENGQLSDDIWRAVSDIGKFGEQGRRYFDLTWAAAAGHTREKTYVAARAKAAKRQEAKEKEESEEGEKSGDESNETPDDPHRLARLNLTRYAASHEGRTLKTWRDAWYVWKRNAYRKISVGELRAKLARSVKEEFDRLNMIEQDNHAETSKDNTPPPATRHVSVQLVSNVVLATSTLDDLASGPVCLPNEIEPNTWIPTRERRSYISMRNGILDIQAITEDRPDYLLPSDPNWFSMVSLGYNFDINATCPLWDGFLRFNLEDDVERIAVAQEWAGYLLVPSTDEQKFLVLEGEGKNGKSVYIAALTAMLGVENVSSVALENFGDRFQRTDTIGKLLNTSSDCGELDKAAEGLLKSFISGDRMFFDRKGIEGMNCPPTARLMIACNNRPRFNDRSDGIWRRMLCMPWKIEVPEDRRVRGMDKVAWWQKSGELGGIFCWALEGLIRLIQQKGFTHSAEMDLTLNDYKQEMNPARGFLTENVEENSTGEIPSAWLYHLYRKWADMSGYHPLASKTFFKEVVRVFKKAKKIRRGDRNSRFWAYEGIQFTQEIICGEKTANSHQFNPSF